MNKIINKLINHLTENPKTLFLIDSLGAMLTAFFLFVIMRLFNEYFGMPKTVFTYLFVIAICFCIYSATCFLFLKRHWTPFIRFISIANLLYCTLIIGLLIKYYPLLTKIETTYFLIEIIVICGLSYIELNVAKREKILMTQKTDEEIQYQPLCHLVSFVNTIYSILQKVKLIFQFTWYFKSKKEPPSKYSRPQNPNTATLLPTCNLTPTK